MLFAALYYHLAPIVKKRLGTCFRGNIHVVRSVWGGGGFEDVVTDSLLFRFDALLDMFLQQAELLKEVESAYCITEVRITYCMLCFKHINSSGTGLLSSIQQ